MNKYIIKLLIISVIFTFYSCELFEEEEEEEEAIENLIGDVGGEEIDQIVSAEALDKLPRPDQLRLLFTEKQYLEITADAQNNAMCVEGNAAQLGLPSEPNSEWYYTYENFIKGMTRIVKFAAEGTIQMRKREIAAFFAHVAQDTGTGSMYGAGCFIQEQNPGSAGKYFDTSSGVGDPTTVYKGRGPLRLTWNYNYNDFSTEMNDPEILLNPDVLTTNPEIGIAGSFWFWNYISPSGRTGMNPPFKPSAHNVMIDNWTPTPNDVGAGRTTDAYFGVTTNILNGGVECDTKNAGKQPPSDRARYFREYARILGADLENVTNTQLTCFTQRNFADVPS